MALRLDRVQVHLFAEDGTEVEQSFIVVRREDGRLGLMYGLPFESDFFPTTENGQPVPVPYSFLDGEVTFAVTPPWNEGGGDGPTFMTFALDRSSMWIVADPLPIESGCAPGPAAADAEALARSIRSNPDLEVTAPVVVDVGGVDALQIDVAVARGAGCDEFDGGRRSSRMSISPRGSGSVSTCSTSLEGRLGPWRS